MARRKAVPIWVVRAEEEGQAETRRRWIAVGWGALLRCRRCGTVLVARQEAGEGVWEVKGHVCAAPAS
jgi:hypothetical protein